MNQVLVGADPECFVQKLVRDEVGRPQRYESIPAFGLFGGSKEKPTEMKGLPEGYFYLEDNAALEFNIPPQKDANSFCGAIATARAWLTANLLTPKEMQIGQENAIMLGPKHQKDPRSQEVGCMPDHDAYFNDGQQREPFSGKTLGKKRYAGGHIHISYNVSVIPQFVAARFLDIYLSLPYLDWDVQHERRTTYGKPGLFRPKDYGIEYRTPSNWWLVTAQRNQMTFIEGALYFARRSYEADYLNLLSEAYVSFPWDDLQKIIMSNDYRAARQLVDLANHQFQLNVRGIR